MGELFREIAHEIVAGPVTFGVEIVQCLILVGIVWIVAVGTRKRPGFIVSMLRERKERVERSIEDADNAPSTLEAARMEVQAISEAARRESEALLETARRDANGEADDAKKAADAEAEAMVAHARQVLEIEREEALEEAREHLVDVVVRSTRRILDDTLSPAEQRALVQAAIMESLEGAEPAAPVGGERR